MESLFTGYFSEGRALNDPAVMIELAERGGLNPDDAATIIRDPSPYDDEVARDITQAARFGANGVPFTVFNQRYALSGAQPDHVWESALRQAVETPGLS